MMLCFKKYGKFMMITLSILNQLLINKFAVNRLLKIPSQLKQVAALPSEKNKQRLKVDVVINDN